MFDTKNFIIWNKVNDITSNIDFFRSMIHNFGPTYVITDHYLFKLIIANCSKSGKFNGNRSASIISNNIQGMLEYYDWDAQWALAH